MNRVPVWGDLRNEFSEHVIYVRASTACSCHAVYVNKRGSTALDLMSRDSYSHDESEHDWIFICKSNDAEYVSHSSELRTKINALKNYTLKCI